MLKIGIIGVGRRSGGHIEGIQRSGKALVTAICDIDEKVLNEVGNRLGIPENKRFTDYKALVDCADVDAVEICTPNYLHVPMALYAAKAGKPVEVEKPLTASYNDDVDKLTELVEKNNIVNMMCFSYRFKPAVRYAKHLIDEGKLGKLINVNIEYLQSGAFIKNRPLEWRFDKDLAGSGALADLGVHLIDLTRFLLGEFESVCSMMTTVIKERIKLDGSGYAPVTVDDITSFIAKLKGDIITNFLVTKCAIGERNTIKYEIYGTDGAIKFNLNEPDVIEMCLSPEVKEAGELVTVKVPDEFKLDEEMCFIDSVNGIMHDYYPTVKDGAKAQIVVDAVLESATQGKTVVL